MRLALLLIVGACSGCLSFANFRAARAIEPRTLTIGIGVGVQHIQDDTVVVPEMQFRYGAAKGLDFGITLATWRGQLDSTIQLRRGPMLELALAPALSFAYSVGVSSDDQGQSWDALSLKLPLLVGFNATPHLQIVLGPTLIGVQGFAIEGTRAPQALLAGSTLGLWLHFESGFGLMPEVAVFTPLVGSAAPTEFGGVAGPTFGSPLYFQAGLAFSLGGIQF